MVRSRLATSPTNRALTPSKSLRVRAPHSTRRDSSTFKAEADVGLLILNDVAAHVDHAVAEDGEHGLERLDPRDAFDVTLFGRVQRRLLGGCDESVGGSLEGG